MGKINRKNISRKYHLFDAQSKTLGRLATDIVRILRGKNKTDFSYDVDGGDFVVVINSDKIKVTGNKLEGKLYHSFSGYPSGLRTVTLKQQMEKDSRKIIEWAIYGMLPKNKLRKKMLNRLFIHKDSAHNQKIDINH